MEELKSRINENLRDYIDKNQPHEKRLMAARGLIPLPPAELAKILVVFTQDENEQIRSEAENSLKELPEDQILSILSDNNTFPELLDYFAKNLESEQLIQAILLNKASLDSTVAYIAENDTSLANLEIIANNKQRILRNVNIVEALSKNSHLSKSIMEEVVSFLCMHLEKSDELKKFVADKELVDNPIDETDDPGIDEADDLTMDEFRNSFFNEVEFSEDLTEESEDEDNYTVDDFDQGTKRESVYKIIQKLNMAGKIKLALQGNRESRRYLIKDPNKLICSAVLKNPKISESEIVLISQSKMISDDILRQISDNKKWTKLYQVKLSLVKNPKTPPHISMNFLRHLREVDLKSIMRDKNLPGLISNGAKNIHKEINRSK